MSYLQNVHGKRVGLISEYRFGTFGDIATFFSHYYRTISKNAIRFKSWVKAMYNSELQ